jgi:hypothetical protein
MCHFLRRADIMLYGDVRCTHAHMHTCTQAHMRTGTHAHMHTCTQALGSLAHMRRRGCRYSCGQLTVRNRINDIYEIGKQVSK